MPSIPKQRRVKRAKFLTKRIPRLGSHSKKATYPLYGKLKKNNNLLAKALSEQKQENQILFDQNVELSRQVNSLALACNKREAAISKVRKNSKDILDMLIAMSNCITNTIVLCQEFTTATETDSRASMNTGGRESMKGTLLSPARGVVKPMVSGHTITKPTIHLSRINTQHITGIANLSAIEEASPDRMISVMSPSTAESWTPTNVSVSKRRFNYENRRGRRLPERIPVTLSRADEEDKRRLSKRIGRLSGRHSKRNSVRLSASCASRHSGGAFVESIENPRVTLNDVSRFLQNSQTINIRELTEDYDCENAARSNETAEERDVDRRSGYSSDVAQEACDLSESFKAKDNAADAVERSLRTMQHFVTNRRGGSVIDDEDIDDYTLMYRMRRPMENTQFDINNLEFPVLDTPIVNSNDLNATKPEITTTLQRITQNYAVLTSPSIDTDRSLLNQSTLNLPMLSETLDHTSREPSFGVTYRQKVAQLNSSDSSDETDLTRKSNKGKVVKKQKKSLEIKDPSSAKVVLQKLVTKRTQFLDQGQIHELLNSADQRSYSSATLKAGLFRDSDESISSTSTCSGHDMSRPRRRKAPTNLKEPRLNTKLRRNL